MGAHHSTGCSLNRGVAGDFHRPYETQRVLHFAIQPGTRETVGLRAIFIAPTKAQGIFIFFSGVFYDSNLFSLPWGYASVLL